MDEWPHSIPPQHSISPQHSYVCAPSQGERVCADRRWCDDPFAGRNPLIVRAPYDALRPELASGLKIKIAHALSLQSVR
jgi:hypothetical protein